MRCLCHNSNNTLIIIYRKVSNLSSSLCCGIMKCKSTQDSKGQKTLGEFVVEIVVYFINLASWSIEVFALRNFLKSTRQQFKLLTKCNQLHKFVYKKQTNKQTNK